MSDINKLKSLKKEIGFNNPEKATLGMKNSMFYDEGKVKKLIKKTVKRDNDAQSMMNVINGDRIHHFLIYEQAVYYSIKYKNIYHLEYFLECMKHEGLELDNNLIMYANIKDNKSVINLMNEYISSKN